MTFQHAADNRYGYLGSQTLVQIQSMNSDYYYDTLITTPGLFDWTTANLTFTTDAQTQSVAILFSTIGPSNSSVLIDGLKFCGARVPRIQAFDDHVIASVNTAKTIEVLHNDINLPESGLSLEIIPGSHPQHGSATAQPDGTILYTPVPDFVGPDNFQYKICNTGTSPEQCDQATVFIQVEEPLTVAIDTFHILIPEDASGQVCQSYFEVEGAILSVQICQDGSYGYCEEVDFPCVDYVPLANYYGRDTICVILCDEDLCDTSIFLIDVTPVNDSPSAQDDVAATVEDEPIEIS
jgi:hypothetical protein